MTDLVLNVTIEKDTMDCIDLLAALISDIKAKKPIAEIVADVLPKFITAMDGISNVGAELKTEAIDDTFALGMVKVEKAFRK